jgi:hypothetical protein
MWNYLLSTIKKVLYSNSYVQNTLQTDESTIICMIFGLNKNKNTNTLQYIYILLFIKSFLYVAMHTARSLGRTLVTCLRLFVYSNVVTINAAWTQEQICNNSCMTRHSHSSAA